MRLFSGDFKVQGDLCSRSVALQLVRKRLAMRSINGKRAILRITEDGRIVHAAALRRSS